MSGVSHDRAKTASEVVVVMCTDLVDSTGLIVRLGQQAADESRRRLFAASYDVIQGTGGQPVKWLGDGVLAVYRSIVAALDGAVALQRAVDRLNRRRDGEPLGLRVGLSLGEATYEDGDWYGVVVVEAARLCDAATGGQILANAIIGTLSDKRGGHELRQLGTRVLKGFDAPVDVVEVGWSQSEPTGLPLPFELERRIQQRFVGRTNALATLEAAWDLALAGTTRLALVSGEPGIGKTSVAAALAEHARSKGALVVYGQCDDQIVASYQPFSDALRQIVTRCDGDVLAAHAAKWEGTLLTLVPELKQRVRGLGAPPVIDPETSELQLFESISDLLARIGDDAPILVVVDDLHWANAPTLRLLAYLVRHSAARTTPLLILGIYRDTPIAPGEAFVSILPDVSGDPNVARLELAGLDDAEVLTLTQAVIDRGDDGSSVELARAIRADTGGNPFLVCEVLRHLVDTDALFEADGVWRSRAPLVELSRLGRVRGVMTERLARLSPATALALSAASVIGDEFDFRVLERIPEVGADPSELARALDEAMAARLLVELPNVAGRYRFAHTLIRAAIADQLSALHRAQLHGQIAEAIAAAYVAQVDPHLRDLVFHYCRGSPVVDPTPAARLGVRAARRANGQLAYADAVDVTAQVLDALDVAGVEESELRFDLLAERAFALTQSGDWDAGSEAGVAAVELARRLQSPRALARVLTRRQSMATPLMGVADAAILAIVDEALASAGDDDWTIAALLAWSTMHRAANGEGAASAPLAKEAVERALRANDVELEAFALHAHYLALLGSPDVSALLDTATLLRDLRRDSPLTEMLGHRFVALTMLIAGDREVFSDALAALASIVKATRSKFWRVLIEMWDPMLALIDGRLEEVEALTDRVLENAQADPNQVLAWFSQIFALRREQDRLAEFAPTVDAAALDRPDLVGIRCVQMVCRLAEGDDDAADAIVDEIARERFSAVPRDWLFPTAAAQLSVACALLGRTRDAATLYELFLPYAGTMAVCATATYIEGASDRFLGILAGLLDRFDAAEAHFDAAVVLETQIGSELLAAHTRYWHGRMLRTRPRPEDRRRATELLNESLIDARRFGSITLERAIESLTAPAP